MKITKAKIVSALRRLWLYSDQRAQCLRSAKSGKRYKCAICLKWFAKKSVQVDHIVPVASANWTEYIEKMFCDVAGLRVLCKKCHALTTKLA